MTRMAALLVLLLAPLLTCTPAGATDLVVDNARLWDPLAAAPATGRVVIRDGLIAAAGPDVAIPEGMNVLDAGGRAVTPGLFHPAGRLGLVEITSATDTMDSRAGETGIGRAFDVQYALNPESLLIQQARAEGVVHAMSRPEGSAEPPFAGLGAVIRLAPGHDVLHRARAGMFVTIGGAADRSRAGDWQLLRRALEAAGAAGDDAEPDDAALQPVLDREIPLVIQTHRASDIRQAVAVAEDFDLRLVLLGATGAWKLAGLLAEHDVDVIVDPATDLPVSMDRLGARPDLAAVLHAAGVRVAFHSDGVHNDHNAAIALRTAAGVAVAHGMDQMAALAAITVNPAAIWLADAPSGLEIGAPADLVVWDGEPLEPASAPVAVFIGGERISRDTRRSALAERYHPGRRP